MVDIPSQDIEKEPESVGELSHTQSVNSIGEKPDTKKQNDGLPVSPDRQSTGATWDGPNDPANPRNWPMWERVFGVFVPSWYSFVVTFGTSVYAPAVFDVSEKFHVSRTAAILGVTTYALGIAVGPVFGAPISETVGRRWVYPFTMPLCLLFTMGSGLATNFGTLLVCRFLAATLGAPSVAVGAGTTADLFDMQKGGAIAGSFFVLMPFLGSSFGPLIGGFAVEKQNDWAWSMWVIIMIGGPAWLLSFFLRETYAKQILKKRAIERGLPQPPKPPPLVAVKQLLLITLLRPLHMILFEPIVSWLSLYVAFAFGILFGFFDAYPYAFSKFYGFDLGQVGLAYIGIIVGIILAIPTFGVIDKTLYARSKKRVEGTGKIPPPEERLYACMFGSVALPIAMFWFGWTARPSVHWIVPILAGVPFGWGLILLFLGSITYIIDTYQALNAASAVAANSLLRYFMAGVFPLFTLQMYERLGVDWAASLLGFISIALLPIPWMFYRWGPLLRRRSSYELGNF